MRRSRGVKLCLKSSYIYLGGITVSVNLKRLSLWGESVYISSYCRVQERGSEWMRSERERERSLFDRVRVGRRTGLWCDAEAAGIIDDFPPATRNTLIYFSLYSSFLLLLLLLLLLPSECTYLYTDDGSEREKKKKEIVAAMMRYRGLSFFSPFSRCYLWRSPYTTGNNLGKAFHHHLGCFPWTRSQKRKRLSLSLDCVQVWGGTGAIVLANRWGDQLSRKQKGGRDRWERLVYI